MNPPFVPHLRIGLSLLVLAALAPPARAVPPPPSLRAEAVEAAAVASWDARLLGLLQEGRLSLHWVRNDTLLPERVHERFAQLHRGVPVWGAELVRQREGNRTVSVFGGLYEGIELDTEPALSADAARRIVEELAGVELARDPELVVLPLEAGGFALAWRQRAVGFDGIRVYFVDAKTGAGLFDYSDFQTQSAVGQGTGVLGDRKKIATRSAGGSFLADDRLRPPDIRTFDLQGDIFRALFFLNGFFDLGESDFARDPDNDWNDGAAVDAHVYAGWTYDYLFKRFGRRGLDDRDIPIRSLVHSVRREDFFTNLALDPFIVDLFYVNAFYAGNGIMVYGEGLPDGITLSTGQSVNFFSAGLDVVTHELTHGVTDFSSRLVYFNESGALNEAFSDILATGSEFFFQTPGGGLGQADYLIGEDVITPGGIRSMQNPRLFGDPDNYAIRFLGPEDNGGVHINSGIANNAFYLAIEGGVNGTSGLRVTGVGGANREQIERVFYRAFVFMLPPQADFSAARAATLQAARDLYGAGGNVERAVREAWTAVGVQ